MTWSNCRENMKPEEDFCSKFGTFIEQSEVKSSYELRELDSIFKVDIFQHFPYYRYYGTQQ